MFSEQTIYIQIEKDLFRFLHVQSGRTAKIQGFFSNQRLAIAHFIVAEKALKQGIYEVYPKSFFRLSPIIIMHQIFNSEGGLCEIEERILREAALSAGARQVFIWQGQPLSSSQLENKVYKKA
ncbi:hypothetical protein [Beggiatoa leptomitoformis]|uniref:Rod shape-determining protein MreB n=1 Tax=Beggiatoa leptomitoformis TaxID=288004 RepID=A0A2N9YDL0_9GAMM|nr:hypothetical protein [Beggiatoa leptomitoformis]AUI68577.1 hypothetical protein BLE401_07560 [Beggiatoa leptomitoformis]QGX03831.1 hypothetical protein AL038_16680 [Beggiatoa leptomitoformis]